MWTHRIKTQKLNMQKNSYKLTAQTYGRASVMSGSSGGAQALIKETFLNAEYVHLSLIHI